MRIPDHLTCLSRNLYAGEEATVRTRQETADWFQTEKEYVKAVYCHPAHLTYMQSTACNARLYESQGGIKIARRNINNLRYADYTTFMAKSKEELKNCLMMVKKKSEKTALKLCIQKAKIMASGPITSWEMMGKKWKHWQPLFSLAPKSLRMVTAARKLKDACSLEESYDKPRHSI